MRPAAVLCAALLAAMVGLSGAALMADAIASAAHDAALIDARQAHCRGAGPCW